MASWNPHCTVAAIVEQDGKFLVVEELIRGELVINQPAGHLDDNESLANATIRECQEETGYTVSLEHVVGLYRWRAADNEQTFIRLGCAASVTAYDAEQPLDTGVQRALWLSRDELASGQYQLRSPLVLACVDDYLAGKQYPLALLADLGCS